MLILDHVVIAPYGSLGFLLREIRVAAVRGLAEESAAIRRELGRLRLEREGGCLTEHEYDARERALLDRLAAIEWPGPDREGAEGHDGRR